MIYVRRFAFFFIKLLGLLADSIAALPKPWRWKNTHVRLSLFLSSPLPLDAALSVKGDRVVPPLAAINQPMGTGTLKQDGLLGQQELDGQEVQEKSHWLDFQRHQPSKAFLPSLPAQPTTSGMGTELESLWLETTM